MLDFKHFFCYYICKLVSYQTYKEGIMRNREFGEFIESHRKSVSLQKLADAYGCSRAYMWDIVHGNVSPPQDYEKLLKMADVMNLTEKQKYEFYDKATLKNDIPPDIKQILINKHEIIKTIRENNKKEQI